MEIENRTCPMLNVEGSQWRGWISPSHSHCHSGFHDCIGDICQIRNRRRRIMNDSSAKI